MELKILEEKLDIYYEVQHKIGEMMVFADIDEIANWLQEAFLEYDKKIIKTEAEIEEEKKKMSNESFFDEDQKRSYDPVQEAYKILVNARDSGIDADIAVEEAIGYLGEALAD